MSRSSKTTSGSSRDEYRQNIYSEADAKLTASTSHSTSKDLPTLINRLCDLLLDKEMDGSKPTGRPGLNRDIRTLMGTIKAHPQFSDLEIMDPSSGAPGFEIVWMKLDKAAKGWKDNAGLRERAQETIGVHKVHEWLRAVEIDGKMCVGGGQSWKEGDVY